MSQSLNCYKQASLKQQQHMSHILSSYKDKDRMKDKECFRYDIASNPAMPLG